MAEKTMERVREIFVDQLGVNSEQVTPEATIADLGADSLDCVELLMALEYEFDICIPDEEADQCKTVQAVVNLIDEKI